ncbi:hypothetical protein [Burkholderia sp. WSM2232]|uniref:hypothetical protein n=1 Tax=Burkholderia sp. WSM2232 TaxID=944436 RepID=UPI0012EC93AE|nr:hypothetical protein [Burkholderia sp. WSM2232]
MLGKIMGPAIFGLTLFVWPSSSTMALPLTFIKKNGVLFLYSGKKSLGQFSNVLVSNAAISTDVEKSTTGTPVIRIATEGSRDKYSLTVPILEKDGVPYTDCVYKSVFDSNDGNRSVGAACALTPLRQFDPEATISEAHLLKYRAGLNWLRNVMSTDCPTPTGIEYGSYRIALCAKQGYPEPSKETTIAFNTSGERIFSVLGYEFIPGGSSGGEFAFIGASNERVILHTNNLECMISSKKQGGAAFKTGAIGKYQIQYSVYKSGKCASGTYVYDNGSGQIDLFGVAQKDSLNLLELAANKEISGLFNLDPDLLNLNGIWTSAPPGKVFRVK